MSETTRWPGVPLHGILVDQDERAASVRGAVEAEPRLEAVGAPERGVGAELDCYRLASLCLENQKKPAEAIEMGRRGLDVACVMDAATRAYSTFDLGFESFFQGSRHRRSALVVQAQQLVTIRPRNTTARMRPSRT